MKIPKKPYSQRSDTEKLESNWRKTISLFEREEYSMAIIRAGTCAEIAANIVIRSELVQKRGLEPRFVDSMLRWANGLQGKFSRIILPLFEGSSRHATLKKHHIEIGTVNDARNDIAHGGRFASKQSAEKLLRVAHTRLQQSHVELPTDTKAQEVVTLAPDAAYCAQPKVHALKN